jgi:hypothetical protein
MRVQIPPSAEIKTPGINLLLISFEEMRFHVKITVAKKGI